jgi:hypothetical protein
MGARGGGPDEAHAERFSQVLRLKVQVIQHLHVVGDKAYRGNQHVANCAGMQRLQVI